MKSVHSLECPDVTAVCCDVSRLFLEQSFEAVFVTDLSGLVLYCNPSVCRNFGFPAERLVGHSIFELITLPSEDQQMILMAGKRENSEVEADVISGEIRSAKGTLFDVHLRAYPMVSSGRPHIMLLVRDISARMSVRKELETSRELMGRIVEGVADAIIATDEQGDLTLFNKGAEKMFGYQSSEIIGTSLEQLIPDAFCDADGKNLKDFGGNQSSDRTMGFRNGLSALRRNGEIFPADATVMKIKRGDSFIFAAVVRDISEQISVQNELRQAKEMAEAANRMKTTFLANMSHELRTPLNAIIGFSEFISEEHLGRIEPPKYREYIKDILYSGCHLLTIVNDILDLSRVEAGEITLHETAVDIESAIESAYRFVKRQAQEKNIRLQTEVDANLPHLLVDERLLKQVVINLASNAVKFTPEGGAIVARVVPAATGGELAIIISDTGIGIAKEDLDRVIKPFEQCESSYTKTIEGTGLGLSLALSLMELHNGRLAIESELGVGTSVILTFPPERVVTGKSAEDYPQQTLMSA
ncbi:PAS domain S-box protein [Kiloniella laminariae]|uniref:histidine kinase n=1 Tax=Kiloniella laminariae TaxID=454162 RepID=A0ABT4LHH8_9PROT|nr:PAS domain S-box protein [Kiloniella laminariae]MCZ4280547.1 PAS domain S-box protein [Kiloniella laminariae]